MPPNSTIGRDDFYGRWRVFYGSAVAGTRWSKSLSWGSSGRHDECVMGLLSKVWAQHTAMTGEECPHDGLLQTE